MGRNRFNLELIAFLILICVGISISQVVEKDENLYNNVINHPRSAEQRLSVKTYWERLPIMKNNFIVNDFDNDVGAEMHKPDIAVDGNGNYGIVWIDERNGLKYIYAQFYNSNDEKIGKNIKISERPVYVENSPVIACNPKGDFVVIWLVNHSYILAQRLNYKGEKIGDNFSIYSEHYTGIKNISVALDNDGSFLTAWYNDTYQADERDGIFTRKFGADGNPASRDMMINDVNRLTSSVGRNFLAGDYNGNFVITWSSLFNNKRKIFLQQIDSFGDKINNNIMVSDTVSDENQDYPIVAATKDGYFFISNDKIYRIYYKDGNFVTSQHNHNLPSFSKSMGEVSVDVKGNLFLFLFRNSAGAYYVRKVNTEGEKVGESLLQLDTGDYLKAKYATLSSVYDNRFYLTYLKFNYKEPGCFLQKYLSDFTPVNNSRKINDDKNSSSQYDPLVYYDSQGYSIIVWKDRRNGRYELYGQVFDINNRPVDENFVINDTYNVSKMDIASFSDGTFLIAFIDDENTYLQKVDINANKVGESTKIMAGIYHKGHEIKVGINKNDDILVCSYGTNFSNTTNLFMQKINKELQPISEVNRFMYSSGKVKFYPISVSINKDFDVFVTWVNNYYTGDKKDEKIYGLFYTDEGVVNSDTLVINTGKNIYYRSVDNRAENKKNFIVAWSGVYGNVYLKRFYNDSLIYENFYFANGYSFYPPKITMFKNRKAYITWTASGNVFGCYINDNVKSDRVNTLYKFENLFHHFIFDPNLDNCTAIFKDKLFFTYENYIINGETGFDIWANVQKLEYMDFEEEPVHKPVNDDALYQNYPNPFNSRTKISFSIYSYHHVKISLFDVLGREVKVLLDKHLDKGFYKIELDASNLPSGVYFCRLQPFNTKVIKMLLVK